MKLRTKIILTTTGLVVILGILTGIVLTQIMEMALNKQLEDKGQSLIKIAAEDIANPLLDGEVLTVQRMLEAVVATGGGIEYAYVTAVQSSGIIHTFSGSFPTVLANANPVTSQNKYQSKILETNKGPIWDIGIKVVDGLDAELHLGFSQTDILSSIRSLTNTILVVTFLGIIMGALAALFISNRITSPLGRLADHVCQLGSGDLVEIEWENKKDEISGLASCFNNMASRLRSTIQHIRASEENYRTLIEAASDAGEGIILLDTTNSLTGGAVCYANEEYARLSGYSREELLSMSFYQLIHPDNIGQLDAIWESGALKAEHPRRFETAIRTKQGEKVFLETSVGETTYQDKGAVICFNRDITEKKRAEMVRSQLIKKVIDAQEEERKRIARELHDETIQSIAALVVGIKTVDTMLKTDEQGTAEMLEDLKVSANTAIKELHQIIYDLRPSLLDDLGLIPALQWYVGIKLEAQGIDATVTISGSPIRLSPEIEIAVFRIIQEAITNIVKYSKATNSSLSIDFKQSSLTVRIVDDGVGFDASEVLMNSDRRGLGLLGMRERAELIGGAFTVQSSPGMGTTITVEIPIRGGGASGY